VRGFQDTPGEEYPRHPHAGLVGCQVVYYQADAGGVHPDFGQLAGFREGYQSRFAFARPDLQDHLAVDNLTVPVPVLGQQRVTILRDFRQGGKAGALLGQNLRIKQDLRTGI
jgi:hypothetical protein